MHVIVVDCQSTFFCLWIRSIAQLCMWLLPWRKLCIMYCNRICECALLNTELCWHSSALLGCSYFTTQWLAHICRIPVAAAQLNVSVAQPVLSGFRTWMIVFALSVEGMVVLRNVGRLFQHCMYQTLVWNICKYIMFWIYCSEKNSTSMLNQTCYFLPHCNLEM